MNKRISSAILAGGPASRMGGVAKPNLVICGETIISRTVTLLKTVFNEIIIVTNTPDEFTQYSGCIITKDQIKGTGPLGGIHAALNVASGDAVFIFAGDMPLLSSDLILSQLKLFKKLECDILVPVIGANIEPLHSICSRSLLEQLEDYLASPDNRAVRDFFSTTDVKFMELGEEMKSRFLNINTPSDIAKVKRIMNNTRNKTL